MKTITLSHYTMKDIDPTPWRQTWDNLVHFASRMAPKLAPLGFQLKLRKVELDILYFLSRSDTGDTARDIIESRNMSKAHISKSVDNLRRTGCVTLREDTADRRCMHLCLTEKGKAFAADYATVVRRIGRQLMAGITLQEKQAIRSAMEKIRRNIAAADITLSHPGHTEETP